MTRARVKKQGAAGTSASLVSLPLSRHGQGLNSIEPWSARPAVQRRNVDMPPSDSEEGSGSEGEGPAPAQDPPKVKMVEIKPKEQPRRAEPSDSEESDSDDSLL